MVRPARFERATFCSGGKRAQGLTRRAEIERAGFQAFFTFVNQERNLYGIVSQAELLDPEL